MRKGESQPFCLSLLRDVYGVENPEQKKAIEKTAQAILNVRQKYAGSSLADIYEKNMYLYGVWVTVHQNNYMEVMKAYGFWER